MYEILIKNKDKYYKPIIENEITVKRKRGFQPSSLEFKAVKDETLDYQEGNPVRLTKDGKVIWYGYVWSKKRDKHQIITTNCYDQLVYFKNVDTYQYEDKTYGELLQMICNDRHLTAGTIEDTGYKIPLRTEREKEFFTILETASNLTLTQTGTEYVLYDKAGKITLQKWDSMRVNDIISYDNTVDFDYETTIEGSYNRIKINHIDDETKKATPHITEDQENIANWGLLQFYAETSNKENITEKSKILLNLLNRKQRKLSIKDAIGNWDVYGGTLIPVYFPNIGDISVNSMMLVDEVTHKVDKDNHHFMDMVVYNKDIMPNFSGQGAFTGASTSNRQSSTTGTSDNPTVNQMLETGQTQIGKPYKWGADGPNAFDCSGFVSWLGRQAGLLPQGARITTGNMDPRYVHQISWADLQPGDILHFRNGGEGHVAFYAGNGQTLESNTGGVQMKNFNPDNPGKYTNVYRFNKLG